MFPRDVYVVYDQKDDTIHSVHSMREMAYKERARLIKLFYDARQDVSIMRWVITTLDEALVWLTQPINIESEIDLRNGTYFQTVECEKAENEENSKQLHLSL